MSKKKKAKTEHLINRYITVTGEYEGFHWYEDAPDEVAFLKNRHRHMFKWSAEISVDHDNRELEFFMVRFMLEREVLPYIKLQDNLGSCEQQAERILNGLIEAYGQRYYRVTVSEDGENSGSVEYIPMP